MTKAAIQRPSAATPLAPRASKASKAPKARASVALDARALSQFFSTLPAGAKLVIPGAAKRAPRATPKAKPKATPRAKATPKPAKPAKPAAMRAATSQRKPAFAQQQALARQRTLVASDLPSFSGMARATVHVPDEALHAPFASPFLAGARLAHF